jgi:hypothetical protein
VWKLATDQGVLVAIGNNSAISFTINLYFPGDEWMTEGVEVLAAYFEVLSLHF